MINLFKDTDWTFLIRDSKLDVERKIRKDTIKLTSLKNANDTITYLRDVLPYIGQVQTVETQMEFNQPNQTSKYSGYFIDDRKYLVGDQFRFRFKLAQKNKIWEKVTEQLLKEDESLYRDPINGNIFQNKSKTLNLTDKSIGTSWFSDLVVVPRYLKKEDFLLQTDNSSSCSNFTGRTSGYYYECNEDSTIHVYLNMTLNLDDALRE